MYPPAEWPETKIYQLGRQLLTSAGKATAMIPNDHRTIFLPFGIIDVKFTTLIDISVLITLILDVANNRGIFVACALSIDAQSTYY